MSRIYIHLNNISEFQNLLDFAIQSVHIYTKLTNKITRIHQPRKKSL